MKYPATVHIWWVFVAIGHTEHWVLPVPRTPALRSTHFVVVSSCTIVQVKEKKTFCNYSNSKSHSCTMWGSPKLLISIVNWFWMINFYQNCRNCLKVDFGGENYKFVLTQFTTPTNVVLERDKHEKWWAMFGSRFFYLDVSLEIK